MIRLNKAIAEAAGIGRRQADIAISSGRVLVNGELCLEPGRRIDLQTELALDNSVLQRPDPEKGTYWLYYKPRGVECSFARGAGESLWQWRLGNPGIRYGGRLDKESEGLMLLSDDGTWLHLVTHPSLNHAKIYRIETPPLRIAPAVGESRSIQLDDGETVESGQWQRLSHSATSEVWQIVLHQGRKRQVRRLAAHFGGDVRSLIRLAIGPFELAGMKAGEQKSLSRQEAYSALSG